MPKGQRPKLEMSGVRSNFIWNRDRGASEGSPGARLEEGQEAAAGEGSASEALEEAAAARAVAGGSD